MYGSGFFGHREAHPEEGVTATVVLTPAESRRLIAKAVAALPQVKRALTKGIVIIARGTTNAFVVEEILCFSLRPRSEFSMGCIAQGELTANISPARIQPMVLRNGKPVEVSVRDALRDFTPDDVFIKGANAVDIWGNTGVLARTHSKGDAGTIGRAWSIVVGRGSHLVVPVGLEKLIPSVVEASRRRPLPKYSTGLPVVVAPLVGATVITEIEAFRILCDISATHIASGGIGGSEGSVVLALEGSEEKADRAFQLVKSIKGEPAVPPPGALLPSAATLDYDASRFTESVSSLLGLP